QQLGLLGAIRARQRLLGPQQRLVDLVGRLCDLAQRAEGLEVVRLTLEDELRVLPCLVRLPSQPIDDAQLGADLEVLGVALLRSGEMDIGVAQIAELEVGKTELPDGVRVLRLVAQDVVVLEGRLPILLLLEVPVTPLESPGLARCRRARRTRRQRGREQEQDDRAPPGSVHHVLMTSGPGWLDSP